MALILGRLFTGYRYLFEELRDRRTDDLFLMSSPFPTLAIVGFYVYFVNVWGPKWMENRPAFNLARTIQIYDVIQICLSAYIVYVGWYSGWGNSMPWICAPIDYSMEPKAVALLKGAYVYFLVKIMDLLDTVFFVLRKKSNQVSFLHVYHHAMMVTFIWGGVRFIGGGHATFLGFINAMVHVVMYSYYLLTSLYPHSNTIWWKKHITQMQIIQFFMIGIHSATLLFLPNCDYQFRGIAFIIVPQNVFMGFLFYDFYKKAYGNKKIQHTKPTKKDNQNVLIQTKSK